jgi:hypothetical protein
VSDDVPAHASLGEEYPKQQARVREILSHYEETYRMPNGAGRGCIFAINSIKSTLAAADRAAITGDVAAMIRLYEEMRGIE